MSICIGYMVVYCIVYNGVGVQDIVYQCSSYQNVV